MDRLLVPISKTALWTAAARACETQREDALFLDPFAAALAGEEGFEWFNYFARNQPGLSEPNPYLAIRTRFFDDFIEHVCHEAGVRQLVFLAAGMDTRAARLSFPSGVRVFEIDYPVVLAHKELILDGVGARSNCERHVIGIDLMKHWESALLEATYDVQSRRFITYYRAWQTFHLRIVG